MLLAKFWYVSENCLTFTNCDDKKVSLIRGTMIDEHRAATCAVNCSWRLEQLDILQSEL